MGLFQAFGKVMDSISNAIDVFTKIISIASDWVDLTKTVSDNEINMITKETEVDNQIRTHELDKKLKERLQVANLGSTA